MKKRVLYTCGTNFEYELGSTDLTFYESLHEIKQNTKCWKSCGIVRVEMYPKFVVKPKQEKK